MSKPAPVMEGRNRPVPWVVAAGCAISLFSLAVRLPFLAELAPAGAPLLQPLPAVLTLVMGVALGLAHGFRSRTPLLATALFCLLAGGAALAQLLAGVLAPGALPAPGFAVVSVLCLSGSLALGTLWPGTPWPARQGGALLALLALALGWAALMDCLAGVPLFYLGRTEPLTLAGSAVTILLGFGALLGNGCDTWPLSMFHQGGRSRSTVPGLRLGPWALFLVMATAIVVAGSLYLRIQLREAREVAQRELATVAALKAQLLGEWYADCEKDAHWMMESVMIQNALRQVLRTSEPGAELSQWLDGMRVANGYQRLVVFDGQGVAKLTNPAGTEALPFRSEDLRNNLALRRVKMMDLRPRSDPAQVHLTLWVPIGLQPGGEAPPLGMLLLTVEARQIFEPRLNAIPDAKSSSETLLVKGEGGSLVYLNDLKHLPGPAWNHRVPLGAFPDRPAARAVMGQEGITAGVDYRGKAVVAALRKVPGTPWSVVAKVDEAELYGGIRQRAWVTEALLMGMVLAVALIMGLLLRQADGRRMLDQLAYERRHKALAERFEHLLQQATDIILLTDARGQIQEANVAACQQYGYTLEEFRTMNIAALRPPEMRNELRERFEACRGNGTLRCESVHWRKDGSLFPVDISAGAVTLGDEPFVLVFGRDITERRSTERALRASEELFSKAFAISPDSINITRQRDGVYLVVSQGFTRITGWTAEEVVGRSALPGDCNIWARAEDRERLVAGLKAHGEVVGLEALFNCKDGRVITGLMSARSLDVDGEPCILTITRDITQRKADERALQESERFLREAQAAGNVGTYIWDLQQDAWQASATLLKIWGVDGTYPNTFQGWADLIPAAHREATAQFLKETMERDSKVDLEYPIIRPLDQEERWLHGRGELERDEQGRPLRLVGVIQDITERKRAEEERRVLESQLHQAQRLDSLGSLAGGVAHDMNNVLGAILSLASGHREDMHPGHPMAASLDTITNACLRGRDVVRSLLYFARKDLEQTAAVDLNVLVQEMIQLLAHTTLKRVELLTELAEPLGPVLGDAGALSHALMNLCVNALDAMPGGGTLLIRTENLDGTAVRLTVKDTGTGMTPEVWSKAVEPFYTTKPLGKGTGLGLAMVFGTMKAHGGDLQIHTREGAGTEVQLTFPALAPEASPAGEARRDGLAGTGGALAILLVDDDELIQDSVGPMLEMLGHTAVIAGSGAAALALLEGGLAVDLIILDMNMPGLDGGETLVRVLERWPDQAVLMASGYSETEIQALIRDRPGVGFIQKPFRMAEIKRKLASMALVPRNGSKDPGEIHHPDVGIN